MRCGPADASDPVDGGAGSCAHEWVDDCRYDPPRCLAAWCPMPACGAHMICSCRVLRPKRKAAGSDVVHDGNLEPPVAAKGVGWAASDDARACGDPVYQGAAVRLSEQRPPTRKRYRTRTRLACPLPPMHRKRSRGTWLPDMSACSRRRRMLAGSDRRRGCHPPLR